MRPALILNILENEYLGARAGHHTPVMLWGPPGVGKSDTVRQAADEMEMEVCDFRAALRDARGEEKSSGCCLRKITCLRRG